MAKNSAQQIEQDEKKIIKELSKNANKSINDIAKSCGFSRQKVWRVIKNLEKNYTIWGYSAVVDEEKLDKKSYIMLVKRTNKPVSNELKNKIIKREFEIRVKKIGIDIINSYFTHGIYDWVIIFNAPDMRAAKSMIEIYNTMYEGGYISDIILLENMFSVVNSGVTNPEIKKIGDFFKI